MKFSRIFGLVAFIVGIMVVANMTMAITINPPGGYGTPPPSQKMDIADIVGILIKIVGWTYVIFFIIAAMFILMAAFYYLFAGGDAEKVGKAKNMIIYAAVAIIVALLAFSLDTIVSRFISG